ncbi:hypothetical protein TU62_04685 [Bacillus cereus]|nr:hypothetical protein TU62_04685 [Bacillus cereus]
MPARVKNSILQDIHSLSNINESEENNMAWNRSIIDSEILAVHAALVPSGEEGQVVLFGGDEHWPDQQESVEGEKFKKTRIYDVKTQSILQINVPSPDSDVFCSHHAFTSDGRLLIAGGTAKWPEGDIHGHDLDFLGHRRCWLYNAHERKWVEAAQLNKNPDQPDEELSGGRWYPGLVTLGNGDVIAFFGHPMQKDFRHRNTLPERYNIASNSWTNLPNDKLMAYPTIEPRLNGPRFLYYPRAFLLPNGSIFFATPMPVNFSTIEEDRNSGPYFSTQYNPNTGNYEGHNIPEPKVDGYLDWSRPAVLLPLLPEEEYRPRVLFCGDTKPKKIDLGVSTPQWQDTAPRADSVRNLTRRYSNAVILPNGEVCLVGGVHVEKPEKPVLKTEIYNPGINWQTGSYSGSESWSVKDENDAVHTRNYHSTALLLPNGKVWVAGGNTDANFGNPDIVGVKRIELYEPDYINVPSRVQINQVPTFLIYNESFEILLDQPATNIQRVALIRNGSVTHSTNNDQRYVGLEISGRNGNTLQVKVPPHGNVAPPGYYMLWVIDVNGNPCQKAKFIRLTQLSCTVITDRSTFSEEEVKSLGGNGQAIFTNALYFYIDGLIHTEIKENPSFILSWDDSNDPIPAENLTLVPGGRLLETDPGHPDIPQRVTYPFHVRFNNMNLFSTFTDRRKVRVSFTIGNQTCTQTLDLTKAPNPYMIDVDPARNNPHWLSTDVRVFKATEGDIKFGDIILGDYLLGNDPDAPYQFIKKVLDKFNSTPNNGSHPFNSIDPVGASRLELATKGEGLFGPFFPKAVYNFAVARVRYRANTTVAQKVKVFFRMFNTVGTSLEYDKNTIYRQHNNTVPLLGSLGDEIVSIPFFLSERVETVQGAPGATSMIYQTLDPIYEVKDITPTPGTEVTMYFGCWLDINQTRKRFPINRGNTDGPWPEASCRSIMELMRGRHMCLVAEVAFDPDPTNPGETPGSSDNLSQRNLAIIDSDNPGGPDSHTAVHTFEVKPSDEKMIKRGYPDELLFRWYNLPKKSEVTLYFSNIDTTDIIQLSSKRKSQASFTVVNKHTIRFKVADASWLSLPSGSLQNIPVLLSIKLPDNITYGQNFRISVHQVSGLINRKIIGAFEFTIPVSKAELILDEERRTLSVMKYIAGTIPSDNRWYPIFKRYLHFLSEKVNALGGDADAISPNPDGSGEPYKPEVEREKGCEEHFCQLIECLLKSEVLDKFLANHNIDPDAFKKCILSYCDKRLS